MAGDVGSNTTSTLVGMFKEVYGESVIDANPASAKLSKLIPFSEKDVLGNKFHQPVDLTLENGVTYAAAGAGAFSLLDPSPAQMQDAQVDVCQVLARASVDYESMFKASQAGKQAFADATRHIVSRLSKSAIKRQEITLLHGKRGIGAISVVAGAAGTRTWTISDDSWAAGIWGGLEGASLDVFAANYTGSKVNTNAKVVVTGVDLDNKQVTVSGNATDLTAIVAGMHIFFETASPTTEAGGIDYITAQTSTFFNINPATYNLWKANQHTVAGTSLVMRDLLKGTSKAVSRGLDTDVVAIVSPQAFEVLNDTLSALRVLDKSYSTTNGENGVEGITYHSQAGKLTILPHLFQKDRLVHIIQPKQWSRKGSTDLTFIERSGTGAGRLIRELTDKAGSEMRCYSANAPFCEMPGHQVRVSGFILT